MLLFVETCLVDSGLFELEPLVFLIKAQPLVNAIKQANITKNFMCLIES
jgi:hypothetical protein